MLLLKTCIEIRLTLLRDESGPACIEVFEIGTLKLKTKGGGCVVGTVMCCGDWNVLFCSTELCRSGISVLVFRRRVPKSAKSEFSVIISSVCPHGTTRLLLDGFYDI